MMATSKPMGADELRAAVRQEIRTALGHVGGEMVAERRRAMEYYLAKPFGNEQDDRSQVVLSDVQDVIEGVMPDFLEIFIVENAARFKFGEKEDRLEFFKARYKERQGCADDARLRRKKKKDEERKRKRRNCRRPRRATRRRVVGGEDVVVCSKTGEAVFQP